MPEDATTKIRFSGGIQRIGVSKTLAVAQAATELRAQGVDIVDFGPGEPDFPTPDHIKQAAHRALDENFTKYTPAAGTPELRKAACEWHARELGSRYQLNECIITMGGKGGLFNALSALLDPGDKVLVPAPYWVTFPEVIRYLGAELVIIPADESSGFRLTADALDRAWSDGLRMVIVNSPCNPSGAVVEKEEYLRILELCRERGAWLLADECYSHFVYDSEPFSIASALDSKPHVIIGASVSKTFAMTGWRIGYTLAPEPVIKAMNKLQSQSTSNPNSIAQKAALAALTGPMEPVQEMLAEYTRRRARIVEGLNDIPNVTCIEPRGAFYAYPNVGEWMKKNNIATNTEVAQRLLSEAHVALVPGDAFGTANHLRLSYATSMERIEEGLRRLNTFFSA